MIQKYVHQILIDHSNDIINKIINIRYDLLSKMQIISSLKKSLSNTRRGIRCWILKVLIHGKRSPVSSWGYCSVKNIFNLYKFRKYAGDWPKCSSILWFLKMFLRIQDPKIPVFSRSAQRTCRDCSYYSKQRCWSKCCIGKKCSRWKC